MDAIRYPEYKEENIILIEQGKIGEVILESIDLLSAQNSKSNSNLKAGLRGLMQADLKETAKQLAIEYILADWNLNIDTNWIKLFLNAQYAEYQSSENTISAYNNDLQNFANFLNTRSLSLDKAQKKDIENFMIHLDQIGLAATTRSRKLSAIKGLYHFTFSEKLRTNDPALQIK